MKKGRELDAEICEVIFGWTECREVPADFDGENAGKVLAPHKDYRARWSFPSRGAVNRAYFCPNYASDYNKALELARYVGLLTLAKDLPEKAEDIAALCLLHYKQKSL